MEANRRPRLKAADDCECCQRSTDGAEESFSCAERLQIFTPEEQRILQDIREVARRARLLKVRMQQTAADSPSAEQKRQAMREELAGLRSLRSKLEGHRLAAAEERMRRLGHA